MKLQQVFDKFLDAGDNKLNPPGKFRLTQENSGSLPEGPRDRRRRRFKSDYEDFLTR